MKSTTTDGRYAVVKNGPREYFKESRVSARVHTGMITTWDVVDVRNCSLVSEHRTRRAALAELAELETPAAPVTFDIEFKGAQGWHGDIGESTEWPTIDAARAAIASLMSLGEEWLGEYRVIEHDSRRVVATVTLAKNPAAVALGRRGGQATSAAKTAAARANAKRQRSGRSAVVLSVRDVGVAFGCEGIVRRASDRRVLWSSPTPHPYGFHAAAVAGAKEWAISHGYIRIAEE
jgi:hypothetical protein